MEPITEYLQMRGLSNRTLSVERLSKQAPGQTGRRSQDKGNRRYARENGLDIVAWAFDYYSGNSALWDRPEARPYFTDPELIASWDVLLGAVVDRITRADSATNREMETWLAEHGKVAVTVDGLRSWLEGSAGKEWENAKLDAHEEWLKTSRRYTTMQADRKDVGSFVGRAPYGFDVIESEQLVTITDEFGDTEEIFRKLPEPNECAGWAKEIFRLCDELDWSTLKIAAWLTAQGAETANRRSWRRNGSRGPEPTSTWNPVTVQQIIRNPFYKGEARERARKRDPRTGRMVPLENPIRYGKLLMTIRPLIDSDRWQRCNDKLTSRPGTRGPSKPDKAMLPGGRVLFCLDCGAAMYRHAPGDSPEYYICSNRQHQAKVVHLVALEQAVHDYFSGDQRPLVLRQRIPGHNHEREIEDVRRQLRELVDDDDLDEEELPRKQAPLLARIRELKKLPKVGDTWDDVDTGHTYAQRWEELPPAERGDWLRSMGITIHARHDMAQIRSRTGLGSEAEREQRLQDAVTVAADPGTDVPGDPANPGHPEAWSVLKEVTLAKLPRRRPGPKPGSRWPEDRRHYLAKLTKADEAEMRARYAAGGMSQRALAAEYGVAQGTAWRVLSGRRSPDTDLSRPAGMREPREPVLRLSGARPDQLTRSLAAARARAACRTAAWPPCRCRRSPAPGTRGRCSRPSPGRSRPTCRPSGARSAPAAAGWPRGTRRPGSTLPGRCARTRCR